MIPYGRQHITQTDIDAVLSVLRSDFLTQGSMVPRFEESVLLSCCSKYAVAVNSATSALHLACLSLGLGKDDVLWTSPITFVASANCALYCGANVDFVDIDPDTYNLCMDALKLKLVEAEKNNCLPKVIVAVHFAGQPCDMKSIHELGQRYGFKIIEDASHGIGGLYDSEPIGNCHYSDITVFSFHPVKIITTAEGGIALTNNSQLANEMVLLRSHGITRDQAQMTHEFDGDWYYQQISLGFNYRMTDLQAALGLSQMQRLSEYVAKRHEIANRYYEELLGLPITLPYQASYGYSAFHLYVIRLQLNMLRIGRREVFDALRKAGIGINVHYIPVHTQPYYENLGFKKGDFPKAETYYEEALSLPMYPLLNESQQDQVIGCLRKILH